MGLSFLFAFGTWQAACSQKLNEQKYFEPNNNDGMYFPYCERHTQSEINILHG